MTYKHAQTHQARIYFEARRDGVTQVAYGLHGCNGSLGWRWLPSVHRPFLHTRFRWLATANREPFPHSTKHFIWLTLPMSLALRSRT